MDFGRNNSTTQPLGASDSVDHSRIQIEAVCSVDAFQSLRVDWDQLMDSSEASVFVSWEWAFNWWKHYGRNRTLAIVTARIDGRLVGVLPLYEQHSRVVRVQPVSVIKFIGTGGDTSPDYLDPPIEAGYAEVMAKAFVAYLLRQHSGWDVLQLSDMNPDSFFYRELAQQCGTQGLSNVGERSASIAYIDLPSSWEDYLATLHRDRRNTIRRTRKKFEAIEGSAFRVITQEGEVDAILDSLIALHHKRWRDHPDGHGFSTPEYVGFHRDAIHANSKRDRIRFYCLEADGKRIAVFYCYRYRGQIFYFQAGFDPDYERVRPGLVLIGYAVENAIQEGNSVFDFLRGEHAYKTQWGKSRRSTEALTVFRPTVSARLYWLRSYGIPKVKNRIKKLLPFLARRNSHHSRHTGDSNGDA